MFKDFSLTFTPECAEYVKRKYREASLIVEYGSGGSTMFAAQQKKTIISVESSASWMIELMGAYKEKNYQGRIIPLWADIGATKSLGYPADNSKWKNFPNYAMLPWKYCNEHQLNPDLILIDGRFRVACFIASCLNVRQTTTLMFDDYVDRKCYHGVTRIAEPVDIIDNRMAIFVIEPGLVSPEFLYANMHFFSEPA